MVDKGPLGLREDQVRGVGLDMSRVWTIDLSESLLLRIRKSAIVGTRS